MTAHVIDGVNLLEAIRSLYAERLVPQFKWLQPHLESYTGYTWSASQLRTAAQRAVRLNQVTIESVEGAAEHGANSTNFTIYLTTPPSSFEGFVDTTSTDDPYPQSFWDAMWTHINTLWEEQNKETLGVTMYHCATLFRNKIEILSGKSLGEVCHICHLSFMQRNLLGYGGNGKARGLVPYAVCTASVKRKNAQVLRATGLREGERFVSSWEMLRRMLLQLLDNEGSCKVATLKSEFRKKFGMELSETALGHSRLSDVLTDDRIAWKFSLNPGRSPFLRLIPENEQVRHPQVILDPQMRKRLIIELRRFAKSELGIIVSDKDDARETVMDAFTAVKEMLQDEAPAMSLVSFLNTDGPVGAALATAFSISQSLQTDSEHRLFSAEVDALISGMSELLQFVWPSANATKLTDLSKKLVEIWAAQGPPQPADQKSGEQDSDSSVMKLDLAKELVNSIFGDKVPAGASDKSGSADSSTGSPASQLKGSSTVVKIDLSKELVNSTSAEQVPASDKSGSADASTGSPSTTPVARLDDPVIKEIHQKGSVVKMVSLSDELFKEDSGASLATDNTRKEGSTNIVEGSTGTTLRKEAPPYLPDFPTAKSLPDNTNDLSAGAAFYKDASVWAATSKDATAWPAKDANDWPAKEASKESDLSENKENQSTLIQLSQALSGATETMTRHPMSDLEAAVNTAMAVAVDGKSHLIACDPLTARTTPPRTRAPPSTVKLERDTSSEKMVSPNDNRVERSKQVIKPPGSSSDQVVGTKPPGSTSSSSDQVGEEAEELKKGDLPDFRWNAEEDPPFEPKEVSSNGRGIGSCATWCPFSSRLVIDWTNLPENGEQVDVLSATTALFPTLLEEKVESEVVVVKPTPRIVRDTI